MADYSGPDEPERILTVEDLVRIGDQVVRGLSELGGINLRPIPGCCTQGCCDGAVLEMLGRE
jgi:hypothetical protein